MLGGRFWCTNRFEMRICDFVFSLIFYWFLYVFGDLEGVMFVLFRDFLRFVFCIDFWSLFCSILGSFWEAFGNPSRSFLASILG